MRRLIIGLVGSWVVLTRTALSAEPQPPDAQAQQALVARLRGDLVEHIDVLLAVPQVHKLAARETLEFTQPWQGEEKPIPIYFGDYALDMPLSLFERAGRPIQFGNSPLFLLRGGWGIVITRRKDLLAPHLTDVASGFTHMIPDGMAKEHEEFLNALTARLERRLTFTRDYEVLERIYRMPFEEVHADDLELVELLETWTWLEIKRLSDRTGAEEYVAFAQTPRFQAIAYGSMDLPTGFWVDVHDASGGITLRFARREALGGESLDITSNVNRLVASVRRHGSDTPGRDMRSAALGVSQQPGGPKARLMARCLLLLAIQYDDDLSQSRALLRSLLDPSHPDHGDFVEMLRRSEQGLCMACGHEIEVDHSRSCPRCGYTPWLRDE